MNNIETQDIISLSDNHKYQVISKVNYNDENYLYLQDIEEDTAVRFCVEKQIEGNIKIVDIEDQGLVVKLLPLFEAEAKASWNSAE